MNNVIQLRKNVIQFGIIVTRYSIIKHNKIMGYKETTYPKAQRKNTHLDISKLFVFKYKSFPQNRWILINIYYSYN